jgi:hypothetical protein
MADRQTHATKAAGFVREMMDFVEKFQSAKPCSRDQYRLFLLVNQAWKCAEVHGQEAMMPDTTKLLRKATRFRIAVNKKFFRECVEKKQ